MKPGYRSRKEQNIERAKAAAKAEANEPMPRLPMREEYPDEISYFNWDDSWTLDFLQRRVNGGVDILGSFKTAPRAGQMVYISAPCRPMFKANDVYRAAMGGKSETALAIMRRDVSLAARDLERVTIRRDVYRQRMIDRLYNPLLETFLHEQIKFDPALHADLTARVPQGETKSSEELIADLMKTIAWLPPKQEKKFDPFELYPYQEKIVESLSQQAKMMQWWSSPYVVRRAAENPIRYLGAPYLHNWYKLNRLTHKLHTMYGDNRPHKINVAPEGIA